MALQKYIPCGDAPSVSMKDLNFFSRVQENAQLADLADQETSQGDEPDVDVDLREVYFLIMHFLSAGPCQRTYEQLSSELNEHKLLPRRYHAWYSRSAVPSGEENDDGLSFPLQYPQLVERYSHIEKDHLVKLLKQLMISAASPSQGMINGRPPRAADVPTLLGTSSYSLLSYNKDQSKNEMKSLPAFMRWPHLHADQVRGLSLREIGGGFTRHHRAPSIRAACYAIAKPKTMVQKMQNIKRTRGHRSAVYCAIFDGSGRYVITGSDDRLVKIWSMETAYCLASCRGHEGDITDLAVSVNNALVASSSNDYIIRVWRLPDGLPVSVLQGHTGAVTAIAFSPRPGSAYHLLSSSDDGTCRIWDSRFSHPSARVYVPKPVESASGKNNVASSSAGQVHQIFCCSFNANGTVFVTGSSDTLARVWNAYKPCAEDSDQPMHEMDVLSGHENDVNYVQFSGCAVASKFHLIDNSKEDNIPKFKNSWFSHDNIVTCSRDGSAIIWVPRSRRSHGKLGRWTRAYHLKVPPPPLPPQPPRGGPRQRVLPTPRGVNMIVWSLDNRFVLAAIMDCRICVWNAADGSLVHSLTGHTQSTYVLDVHPFNPRIAMSAGYDGRTIVWDIWEGIPIQTYEISRFKLVDGKFSPDGTSIILSDDVGQLYILSTGQGESQKDAQYDQFFLGDYRPLIQDTSGHVLDQETQLAPYRRNIQDLLCDSGMEPYPEPYQTMYQKRRLGALGLEWKPSSLRLASGPDFSVDPDYQLLPLADLDVWIEPIPEFMDWEPEIEVYSDDADSEYNVPEECSSGEERINLCSGSSSDAGFSEGDSDVEDVHKREIRRSKRKKRRVDVAIMTSSGRRIKRRNLDVVDGSSFGSNRTRKSNTGQRVKKKSKSRSRRPKRAAARNALSLFSRITGKSIDGEYEDNTAGDSSDNESQLFDSSNESEETDSSLQDKQDADSKQKHVVLGSDDQVPESLIKSGNRPRLIIKFSTKDSNKHATMESASCRAESQSNASHEALGVNGRKISLDLGFPAVDSSSDVKEIQTIGQVGTFESIRDLTEGYANENIRWGGVKIRSSKRQRLVEPMSFDDTCKKSNDDQYLKPGKHDGASSPRFNVNGENNVNGTCEALDGITEVCNNVSKGDEPAIASGDSNFNDSSIVVAGVATKEKFDECKDRDEPKRFIDVVANADDDSFQIEGGDPSILEIRRDPLRSEMDHTKDDKTSKEKTDNICEGAEELSAQPLEASMGTVPESQPTSRRMYDVVYRRSKHNKHRSDLEGGAGMRSSTSNVAIADADSTEEMSGVVHGTHSSEFMGHIESNGHETEKRHILEGSHRVVTNSKNNNHNLRNRSSTPCEEWGSSSRSTVGLRSSRNRRSSYNSYDATPLDKRKAAYKAIKDESSWLLLSVHEEGSQYIPQMGDDVVYLRQGHKEYIEQSSLKVGGPWTSVSKDIQAVEFCKVVGLEYSFAPSGDSVCKMILQFSDTSSSIFGKSFKLTLPEITSFPDFLVERSRFDAALQRNWSVRDKCKVWWKSDNKDGNWWDARILSVQPKSPDFPDSPWDRFAVQYKDSNKQLHSPWELYDSDIMQLKQPNIDDHSKHKLLAAFSKLEKSGNNAKDPYAIRKLTEVSEELRSKNRFPAPVSLELIHSRLNNDYYRSLEAVKHDIGVMLEIMESYFGRNVELSTKINRLSELFSKTLSTL